MTSSSRVTKACDGCRVRKVKCNGAQPCSQCAHFNVQCVTSQVPKKRKNPVRGRLLAKARGEGVNSPTTSQSPEEVKASSLSPSTEMVRPAAGGHPLVPAPAAGYKPEFFQGLLPQFEEVVYPFNPIISPAEILLAISNMHHSFEDAALVYAYGAVTTFLTQTSNTVHGSVASQMNELMHHSLKAHKEADLRLNNVGHLAEDLSITTKRVMTCIYLEISMMALKRFDRSFAFLREAIAMLQILQAQRASGPELPPGSPDLLSYQRLYWEAFIHERFLTIASGYPSILVPLKTGLSDPDPNIPRHIELGFNRLVQLFRILDGPFLSHWGAQDDALPDFNVQWIESKQVQLDQDEINAAEDESELWRTTGSGFSDLQHADLFITRLWMRTLIWQLALSKGLLRLVPSQDTHESLSLHFPALRLSTQLRSLISRLDGIASISTQGSGILQKLFEITSTIADVFALPSIHHQELKAQVFDFLSVVRFLFHFERIRDEQKQYLREKFIKLQQVYSIDGGIDDLP